jgi:hypothetical protein
MGFKLIKVLLSAICVSLALIIALTSLQESYSALTGVGLFVFLAVAPWVSFTRPSRSLALFVLFISLCILILGVFIAFGSIALPTECVIGKKTFFIFTLLCGLENKFYSFGGYIFASSIWFILGFMVLYGSITIFKKSLTHHSSGTPNGAP